MDNLNRTISFILGLVVVIVFLAFITGRLNLKSKTPFLGSGPAATPKPTTKPTLRVTPIPTVSMVGQGIAPTNPAYHSYSAIPATGSPTIILPILISALTGGVFLKKKI